MLESRCPQLFIVKCIFSVAAESIFKILLELLAVSVEKLCVLGLPGGKFLWLSGFPSYAVLSHFNQTGRSSALWLKAQHSWSHVLTSKEPKEM